MSKINLPDLDVKVDPFFWDDLVRRFAVERQHEEFFIARQFMEIPGADSTFVEDQALSDCLDLIRFQFRSKFKKALIEKYRTGNEFQRQGDADAVFELSFRAAESIAVKTLNSTAYTVQLMMRIEIYFWVILQVMRHERGEHMDAVHKGANARMGDSIDLLDIGFSSILE